MNPFLISKNRKLRIKLTPLIENADESSALLADVTSGSSTITVENINKFAINKILLIGELGSEQSEIIKTHGSTAPSGSTVTLASNTVFAHKAGTTIYVIQYDQVELSQSSTISGSKTLLTTTVGSGLVALEADQQTMTYDETEFSSGYYFARYKNSISGTFSGYCDAVPYGGFTENTAGSAIDFALRNSKVREFTDDITQNWCYEQITDCFRFIQGKQKRWNKYQSLNSAIGTTARGTRSVDMPTDIYDRTSNRSLTGVRIGEGKALVYKDPDEFEDLIYGEKTTTVATQQTAGGTTLVLTDTDDFDDSGSVIVFISNVQYTITYTGITRSTHTLTGIPASGTGAITVTIPVATNVWFGYSEGQPLYYTVRNEKIEYFPMPSALWDNKNIFADYWTEATTVNSDGDEIDTERFDMVKYWLTWKMRAMKDNDGVLNYDDGDYKMFADRLKDAVVFKGSLLKYPMKPKVNSISYRGYGRTRRRYNSES